MKIMAMDKWQPGATLEKILALQKAEVLHAWKLYQQGIIREWYFREDRPGVVVMFECASAEEARKYINELPLVKAGLLDFDLIPLGYFRSLEAALVKE